MNWTDEGDETSFCDRVLMQARARVGMLLQGRWVLDELLGAGGMAAVYAATHRDGRRAAIKVLHPDLSADPAIRARFQREGYAANLVGHDGAVRVLEDDVVDDGGELFLVTELLQGETLEDRRVRLGGRVPPGEVLAWADQVLDVLVAAHAKGVVHRDLKPDNLFLTEEGKLKVLDFGIARVRELASDSHLTKNGVLLGTPAFMSPEQLRGFSDEVDAQSDLWACGATMFALLAGRTVHEGATPHQVMMIAATTPAPALRSVAPDVPSKVAALVDRALCFEKKKRWADAATMQKAVRAARRAHRAGAASPVHSRARVISSSAPTLPARPEGQWARPSDPPVAADPRPIASSRLSNAASIAFIASLVAATTFSVARWSRPPSRGAALALPSATPPAQGVDEPSRGSGPAAGAEAAPSDAPHPEPAPIASESEVAASPLPVASAAGANARQDAHPTAPSRPPASAVASTRPSFGKPAAAGIVANAPPAYGSAAPQSVRRKCLPLDEDPAAGPATHVVCL